MSKKPDLRPQADITLDFPVDLDGDNFSTLTMRRPKVKDTRETQRKGLSDFEAGLEMMARLCNVPPEVIAELDEIDAGKVQKQLEAFRGESS
jgi:hypothetical protein